MEQKAIPVILFRKTKRALLESRRAEASGLHTILREAAERNEMFERESEIIAGFEGKIVRIAREPAASEVPLRISFEVINTPRPTVPYHE